VDADGSWCLGPSVDVSGGMVSVSNARPIVVFLSIPVDDYGDYGGRRDEFQS